MKAKTKLKFAIVLIVLWACNKDDSSCPDTIYLGQYDPTNIALSTIPYQKNTTIVFSDSLGGFFEFKVSEKKYHLLQWSIPGHCPSNYYQMVNFSHEGGMWEVLLKNDTASFLLEIQLLSLQDYNTQKIFDDLVVSIGVDGNTYFETLELPVDQRLLRDPEFERRKVSITREDSLTIFGKIFRDVYHEKYKDSNDMFKTYYNYENGIVSFRDNYGKRWVFESVK